MNARTELLLIELMWGLDLLTSSPMRLFSESFEGWSHRHGLARRIARLEAGDFVEETRGPDLERVRHLTQAGRAAALGGRDPIERANRIWDETWQVLVYDVPTAQRSLRLALQRSLRQLGFGRLQGSVWVSPDPVPNLHRVLARLDADPSSLLIIKGMPATGETNAEIVARAWNFDAINRHYDRYMDFIRPANRPPSIRQDAAWRRRENALWLRAVRSDPLLPRQLWPKGYRGEQAFFARAALLAAN